MTVLVSRFVGSVLAALTVSTAAMAAYPAECGR
jgi:hypothetical protein